MNFLNFFEFVKKWMVRIWRVLRRDSIPFIRIFIFALPFIFLMFSLPPMWVSTARITNTYLSLFKITSETAYDSDRRKWEASNLPMANIIEYLRRQSPRENEKTLTFRQADFSLYGDIPFVNVYDNTYADLFKQRTDDELYNDLKKRGIMYVATPFYAMPERYNTGFNTFLSNMRYVERVLYDTGYELFKLRDTPKKYSSNDFKLLKNTDFTKEPQSLRTWFMGHDSLTPLEQIFGRKAKIRYDAEGKYVELTRKKSFRSKPHIVDTLQPSPLLPAVSPFIIGESDFTFDKNTVSISAEISGKGYVEIVVGTYSQDNLQELKEQTVIWSGVLFGKKKKIHSIFDDHLLRESHFPLTKEKRLYRIFFKLQDGAKLKLYSWSVSEHLNETADREYISGYKKAITAGWSYISEDSKPRPLYFTASETENQDNNSTVLPTPFEIKLMQFDSRANVVESPLLMLPPNVFDVYDDVRVIDILARELNPTITSQFAFKGHGAVSVNAHISCYNGATYSKNIGLFLLLDDMSRLEEAQFTSTCLPTFIRYSFKLMRNRYLVNYITELSLLNVGIVDTTLTFSAPDEKIYLVNMLRVQELAESERIDFVEANPAISAPKAIDQ